METGKSSGSGWALWGVLASGVLLLAWSAWGFFAPQTSASSQAVSNALGGKYVAGFAAGSECGDLRDVQNVQHLSHHPAKFADCLKQVDQEFLKQATGRTYAEIVGG